MERFLELANVEDQHKNPIRTFMQYMKFTELDIPLFSSRTKLIDFETYYKRESPSFALGKYLYSFEKAASKLLEESTSKGKNSRS